MLFHSQPGEPGHVSWGILQDPFAENTKQHRCNPTVQVPRSHYKLRCKSTNIIAPNIKAEWQTVATKIKQICKLLINTVLKANNLTPTINH